MDTLNALAQVAIALAGFSAVVVIFTGGDGSDAADRWHRELGQRFTGMILHAFQAAFFAFVPQMLSHLMPNPEVVWASASLALGAATLIHAFVAYRLERRVSPAAAFTLMGFGLVVFLLQMANLFSVFAPPGPGLYLVGVFFHVVQSGFLFFILVMTSLEGRKS
jgi:hypothetical protein